MRRSRAATILLCCFFSLIVGSRSSVIAQQSPQTPEKERGIDLYRKGDFNEAVKALKEAVKKQGGDSDAWYYLGLSSLHAGKIKDARKALEKAMSLRPDFAPAYSALANIQLLGNDNRGAMNNAEKALALDPKNLESLYIAGVARLRENAPADAMARAEEALKIKRDYPQALILKTEALLNMFGQERAKLAGSPDRHDESKPSGDAGGKAQRLSHYSLLKAAAKSLEAYLELNPDLSERSFWSGQLEAILFYAQWAENSISDKFETSLTSTLRPTILHREKARYTEAARAAGVEGTVILMVVFANDGLLKHIMVIQGLSHGLTGQALEATRKIRFTPAMRDGKPVSLIGNLEFLFSLY